MEIREAHPEDALEIAALLAQLGYAVPAEAVAMRLEARAAGHAVLVAGGPRGIAGVLEVQRRAVLVEGPFAEITALVVDENLRRQGVGRSLVRAAETWARTVDLTTVRLRSNVVRGPAHLFYLRLGYALVKTQHAFVRRLAG